jgi:hypothetical protein
MQVNIIQKGRVLRSVVHEGQTYVQAAKKGKYAIRLHNPSWKQRLAVISVDGVNVLNGEDAGTGGPGYILAPFETVDIPGFRRDDGKVAAFRFKEQGESYAAQTGRGTSNVGVIGVAVFDEKVKQKVAQPPIVIREDHHHHHYPWRPWVGPYWATYTMNTAGVPPAETTVTCSTAPQGEQQVNTVFMAQTMDQPRSRSILRSAAEIKDVGTAYGEEVTFHTTDAEFERASNKPAFVHVLRYATYERLKEWGVPIDTAVARKAPNPFPASMAAVPAPPGWNG